MNGKKLLNETARAFLRHAVGQWYADATKAALENVLFRSREHTPLTEQVADKDRTRFMSIIIVRENGTSTIHPALTHEITRAERQLQEITRAQGQSQ